MADQNARVLDQFKQQAEGYAALVGNMGAAARDPLIALLEPEPADHILDVGCGSGQFIVSVAPLVAEAVGADLTPAMLDRAREAQAKAGLTNIRWLQSDSIALPLDDDAFDIVVSRSMFHHAADPAATLAEMRRVCRPGGRIAVSDLTPAEEKSAAFDAIELLRDPSHMHALTATELRAIGAKLGLEEIGVHPRSSAVPLEPVLATSFPPEGMLDHIRRLYARDADSGGDAFGMRPEWRDGALWLHYPQATLVWRRPQ